MPRIALQSSLLIEIQILNYSLFIQFNQLFVYELLDDAIQHGEPEAQHDLDILHCFVCAQGLQRRKGLRHCF